MLAHALDNFIMGVLPRVVLCIAVGEVGIDPVLQFLDGIEQERPATLARVVTRLRLLAASTNAVAGLRRAARRHSGSIPLSRGQKSKSPVTQP